MLKKIFQLFIKYNHIKIEKNIQIFSGLIEYCSFSRFLKQLKILNYPIISIINISLNSEKYKTIELFASENNLKLKCQLELFKNIIEQIPSNYKNIVYIRGNLGEVYILNHILKDYMQKKNFSFENTCFINAKNRTFKEIFNIFNPEVKFSTVNIDIEKMIYSFEKSKIYNNYKIELFPENFINLSKYLKTVEKQNIKSINKTFYQEIIGDYNFDNNLIPQINLNGTKGIIDKFKDKLNIQNFIIIMPKANSIKEIQPNFWNKLISELKSNGYDIFVNNEKELTLTELIYLTSISKGVIGLNSGAIEILTSVSPQTHIIYTKYLFANLDAIKTQKVHSKKLSPFNNYKNIYEYVYSSTKTEELLIKNIIRNLEDKETKNEKTNY